MSTHLPQLLGSLLGSTQVFWPLLSVQTAPKMRADGLLAQIWHVPEAQ